MTQPLPRRPPGTAEQRRLLREDLHAIVDDVVGAWPTIDRQAALQGSGYPTSTLGSGITGTSGTTLVESSVLRRISKESEWLAHFSEFVGHARTLQDDLNKLKAADDAEIKAMRGRQNDVDVCTECNEPIAGRTKRLDNQPYHHPDDQPPGEGSCWWKAYNRIRGRRPAEGE